MIKLIIINNISEGKISFLYLIYILIKYNNKKRKCKLT